MAAAALSTWRASPAATPALHMLVSAVMLLGKAASSGAGSSWLMVGIHRSEAGPASTKPALAILTLTCAVHLLAGTALPPVSAWDTSNATRLTSGSGPAAASAARKSGRASDARAVTSSSPGQRQPSTREWPRHGPLAPPVAAGPIMTCAEAMASFAAAQSASPPAVAVPMSLWSTSGAPPGPQTHSCGAGAGCPAVCGALSRAATALAPTALQREAVLPPSGSSAIGFPCVD
mmetsp:Transcript_3542/g.14719  ORF Transcript_3542/g.14719 Transcript_3542/m.14719 type:complete len:233 (+) Transcript_3542:139-837(+)